MMAVLEQQQREHLAALIAFRDRTGIEVHCPSCENARCHKPACDNDAVIMLCQDHVTRV